LGTRDRLDVVAKILCPDSVNLFSTDFRFSKRVGEVAWAKWWGEQDVSWVPEVYATRSDATAREFWILQEYLPQVGWPDATQENAKVFDSNRGRLLLSHAADLHAYSRDRIDELLGLFPDDWPSLPSFVANVAEAVADASFLTKIGVSDDERTAIDHCCRAVERRPRWIEEWEIVCITSDIAPDNVGVRRSGKAEELVTFDWSCAGLAPMEAEIEVMLGRLENGSEEVKAGLVRYYLNEYAARTGRRIPDDRFMARLVWARFIVHFGRIAASVKKLRWVPGLTGTAGYIHLCVDLCERLLPQLAVD